MLYSEGYDRVSMVVFLVLANIGNDIGGGVQWVLKVVLSWND